MEFIALLIMVGAVWWAFSHTKSTLRTKAPPETKQLSDQRVSVSDQPTEMEQKGTEPAITLQVTFGFAHTSIDEISTPPDPSSRHDIVIADNNTQTLSLSYDPYEWPRDMGFRSDLNFWIQHPHVRDSHKRWYEKEVSSFYEKLKALGDYEGEWVLADAKVALVPVASEAGVQVILNGVVLHKLLPGSESLIRRMKRQKLEIKVTKCHARLEGGGTLSDGRQRGIYVSLALKPFRRY